MNRWMEWATIFSDKPQTASFGGWKMLKIHQMGG